MHPQEAHREQHDRHSAGAPTANSLPHRADPFHPLPQARRPREPPHSNRKRALLPEAPAADAQGRGGEPAAPFPDGEAALGSWFPLLSSASSRLSDILQSIAVVGELCSRMRGKETVFFSLGFMYCIELMIPVLTLHLVRSHGFVQTVTSDKVKLL